VDNDKQMNTAKKAKPYWGIVSIVALGLILGGLFFFMPANKSRAPAAIPVEPVPPMAMQEPIRPPRAEQPQSSREPQSLRPTDSSPSDSMSGHIAASPPAPVTSAAATAPDPSEEIGNIIYNTPEKMTLGEAELIEVRISNKALNGESMVGEGAVTERRISISKEMTVTLCCGEPSEDHAFDITSVTPIKQLIGKGDYTQWVFSVVPRVKGKQTLQLTVTAIYKDQAGVEQVQSKVLTDMIEVDVDIVNEVLKWLAQHWYWLGLLLLIPLMAVLVMRGLKNRNRTVVSGNETVFISYRRSDSSGYTLAIYQKLKDALGDDKVFMDLDDIPHGVDFSEHLDKVLGNATTVLIMIGEGWLNASNEQGRRLDDSSDFVRIEVASALKRDVKVIPVLLKQAQMPSEAELPEDLQALSRRNAIRIHDDQFESSIQKLVKSIG
jgi:hypothetical protein